MWFKDPETDSASKKKFSAFLHIKVRISSFYIKAKILGIPLSGSLGYTINFLTKFQNNFNVVFNMLNFNSFFQWKCA